MKNKQSGVEEFSQEDIYSPKILRQYKQHMKRVSRILDAIKGLLKNIKIVGNINLIEIGCGDGYILDMIKSRFNNIKISGLEYNSVRLARSAKRNQGINHICGSGTAIPTKESVFEVVVCTEVIEHILDDNLLLREINRVLKLGGHLILTTPNINTFSRLLLKHLKGKKNLVWIPSHVREYTYEDIISKVRQNGFVVEHYESIGFEIPMPKARMIRSISDTCWFADLCLFLPKIFKRYGRIHFLVCKKLTKQKKNGLTVDY